MAKERNYPLEREVKKQIKALLDQYNAYWLMPVTFGYGASGHPDFIGVANGRPFVIEAKSKPSYEPTAIQYRTMARACEARSNVFLIHSENLATLETWLRRVSVGFLGDDGDEVTQYVDPRIQAYMDAEGYSSAPPSKPSKKAVKLTIRYRDDPEYIED